MGSITEVEIEATGHWVPDDQRFACVCCNSKFSLLRRKHHCRACGEVVCQKCLQVRKIKGQKKQQQVCQKCRDVFDAVATGKRLSNADARAVSKQYKVLQKGYLHIAQPSKDTLLPMVKQFKRRYFTLVTTTTHVTRGAGLLGFQDVEMSQQVVMPLVVVAIKNATVVRYGLNCLPRVGSYHFGIESKEGPEGRVVLEAETAEARERWIESLVECGAKKEVKDVKAERVSKRSVKEGFMTKMGKKEKEGNWRSRYVILDFNPCRLEYFVSYSDARQNKTLNVLLMDRETRVKGLEGEYLGRPFTFAVCPSGGRRYLLSALNESEKKRWMKLIKEVSLSQNKYMSTPNEEEKEEDEEEEMTLDMDEEEIALLMAQLTDEQREQLTDAKARVEQDREKRRMELAVLRALLGEEEGKMGHERDLFLKVAKRVQALMRVVKKDTAALNEERGDLEAMVDEIEGDRPLLEEIGKLIEEDETKVVEQEVDLVQRRQELEEQTVMVDSMESERARLDALLEKFADVLSQG